MIAKYVLSSTRISWGRWIVRDADMEEVEIRKAPHNLALRQVCAQLTSEIGDWWLRLILFNFEAPETMLDVLTDLPRKTLSKIRHVRVRGDHVPIMWYRGSGRERRYRLHSVVKLLPGLRLDELTVLGNLDPVDNYRTLNELIKEGDGWKKLRYISHNSEMLGYYDRDAGRSRIQARGRISEPAHWQSLLRSRDGEYPDHSVTLYRATIPYYIGAAVDEETREVVEQQLIHRSGDEPVETMTDDSEINKEVLVVVKRGTGADYEVGADSRAVTRDIRRILYGREWSEIRVGSISDILGSYDLPFSYDRSEEFDVIDTVADVYTNVDEYVWTHESDESRLDIPGLAAWCVE
ncbi:hypothetical protein F5Y13DRAFT_171981 [Hypoxylon sp. FL1857]|nr:hypothetical protein F5Y13DRAFT_171981 [Hypoxylon sp. FL1857]